MTVSPSRASALSRAGLYLRSLKARPKVEYANAFIFRPLAHLVVLALLRTQVRPTTVLLANFLAGTAGAYAILRGWWLAGAVLLQVKTVLDNADGQLARARGEESETGRYLDSELDFIVNAALFAAIGLVTGQPWLALAAFLAMTLVLSADFNLEKSFQVERGQPFRPAPDTSAENQRLLALLRGFYNLVFAPQDRLLGGLIAWRVSVTTRGLDPDAAARARHAYHDGLTVALAANCGLSTQLLAAGICLAAGWPVAFLWLQLLLIPVFALAFAFREGKARHATRAQ